MSTYQWLSLLIAPLLVGLALLAIKRWLGRQDADRARQTTIIEKMSSQVSGMRSDFAALKEKVEQHDDEIRRFRDMVDRWNTGPFPARRSE